MGLPQAVSMVYEKEKQIKQTLNEFNHFKQGRG